MGRRKIRFSALAVFGVLSLPIVAVHLSRAEQQEQVVRVNLQEWQLGFRTVEVKDNPIRVEIVNAGQLEHAFELEGKVGGHEFGVATGLLEPGQQAVLVLELPPGDYQVYCPVPGHAQAGMAGKLVVRAQR